MTHTARIVLKDAQQALTFLETERDPVRLRIFWAALAALLRATGHVLKKVDAQRDPAIRKSVEAAWKSWRRESKEHLIFWEFIEKERNNLLKEYVVGWQEGPVLVTTGAEAFDLGEENLFRPLLDGPFAGEDFRDVAHDAVRWWKARLDEIDNSTHGTSSPRLERDS